jgi:hypothetical protein
MFNTLGGTIALLVASLPAGAVPLARDGRGLGDPIPIRLIAGRLAVVPVIVQGTGPYPFLLDTGGTSSMVDEGLARELGLPDLGATVQETATGAEPVHLVRTTLRLGGVESEGDVIRARLTALEAIDRRIRGVVGQDLLRRANWWLDYRGRALVQDTEGALATLTIGERVSVRWEANRPTVEASLRDGRPLRLVLDSAAVSALLFRDIGGASTPAGSARATTHGGAATVPLVTVGLLRVGAVVIRGLDAGLVARAGAGRPEDGLLPTRLFEGIYFDNRAGAVVLNPRRSSRPAVR